MRNSYTMMKPFTHILFIAIASTTLISACQKKTKDVVKPPPPPSAETGNGPENPPPPPTPPLERNPRLVEGTFKDMSGLDGCKWIIVINDTLKIEPTNLAKFGDVAAEGKVVDIEFELQPGVISICMAGKPAFIRQLEERK